MNTVNIQSTQSTQSTVSPLNAANPLDTVSGAQAHQVHPRVSRLRLTRRGRFVFTSLAAAPLVALALVAALNGGIAAATSDLSTGTFDYVTVEAGQSLWGLAQSVAPNSDPREVISDIVRLNQLENSELHPGDRIAIPAAYSR